VSPSPDLLRRLDWRFLLPVSPEGGWRRLALFGGPAGLADVARSLGIAHEVSTEAGGTATTDLLAILRGGPRPPAAVLRSLRPGGIVYLEPNERRSFAAPAAPLRSPLALFRRRGLTVTGIWAVWPAPEDYAVYLPLAAPGAVRWFARTLHPAPTLRERLLEAGLRLGRGRSSALLLTRSFAFMAMAGPGPAGRPALLADPGLPAELRRGDLEPVLVTHGGERVLVLPFPRRGRAPAGVLKVSRCAAFNGKTTGEQGSLARFRPVLGDDLGRAVPAGRGCFEHGGLAVGIEEYAAGRPLLLSGSRWGTPLRRKVADLRLAVSWLTGMNRRGELRREPWSEREVGTWIAEPCAAFLRSAGGAPEERLFAAAQSRARELCGRPFPLVPRHRDFTPWNLLRDGRRLRVLDWEGLQNGPPACDLFHFLTHWAELAHVAEAPEARLRAFRETLVAPRPGDPVAAAAAEALAAYCTELRLDRDFLPVLLVHTWVEIALRGGAPRDAAYVGVLAEHTETLFREAGHARRVA